MPIPKPTPEEGKNEFISRCIRTLKNTDPDKDSAQIAGICFAVWEAAQ